MRSWSRAVTAVLAVGVVAVSGVWVASAGESSAADEQQSLVEDFAYPGAARILAEDNVKLVSGDGHIVYAPCAQQPVNGIGVIEVRSTDFSVGKNDGLVCFKVLGDTGSLVLLIPDVFEIRGDGFGSTPGHKGTAEVKAQSGESRTVVLNPNGSQQVGIGRPNGVPETLLKLEVKP
ncbi:hypothetical protein C8D87_104137 [Lentzea atacamensis]|uniref:Secreted protein n=1 Tax=Lentzea atacamensis TaxID=531938 RepID=A0ABX9EAT0_9PSEU|nr:hypothetical protein C8D87_104137 [Lentzea atacamensis]